MISGALGGLGGFAYIVPSVTTWNFEVGVAGAGFLALAVMIFGSLTELQLQLYSLQCSVHWRILQTPQHCPILDYPRISTV